MDKAAMQKLQSSNKYFIVHFQNGIRGLEDMTVNGDTVKGRIVPLPPEHSKYLAPVSTSKSRVKKTDKKAALMEVHLYTLLSHDTTNTILSQPLSSFIRTDVYELNKSATTSNHILSAVGVTLTSALILGTVVIIVSCNCPQVYVKNNDQYNFNSGLYSGAVYSTLERTDYLPLTTIPSSSRNIEFKIANAKNEEQFINHVQLLRITHPANIAVLPDRHGNLLTYQNVKAPLSATADKNNDIKSSLLQTDEQYYSFDNNANKNGFSDIMLTFGKEAGAEKAKLLVHARNTKWGGYLHKDFLELFGKSYEKWREKQEKADPAELEKWQTDQALPLMAYLKTDTGWKFIDYFPLIGNTASRDMIMEINIADIKSRQIEIKLETIFRFWDLDFAAIDYTTDQNFEKSVIEPYHAVKTDGTDQKENLQQNDKQYSQLKGDEAISFKYNVTPPTAENTVASYILISGGYYHSLEQYAGKPNYTELYKFKNKGAFDKFSRKKYKQVQEINAMLMEKSISNP